jgi:hypothetical protein
MSGNGRNTAVVSREYREAPDQCARALELLLKTSKKAVPADRPEDARKEDSNASGKVIVPGNS